MEAGVGVGEGERRRGRHVEAARGIKTNSARNLGGRGGGSKECALGSKWGVA